MDKLAHDGDQQDAVVNRLAHDGGEGDAVVDKLAHDVGKQDAVVNELADDVGKQDAVVNELADDVGKQDAVVDKPADDVGERGAVVGKLGDDGEQHDAVVDTLADDGVKEAAVVSKLAHDREMKVAGRQASARTGAAIYSACAMRFVLYNYWRSSCSFRVRIALAHKKLDYEYAVVNILNEEHATPEHQARNPMGYVPCLLVDGAPYSESVAIMELLEDLHPHPALYPQDPFERARVRALVEVVNADTQPLQNRHVLLHVSKEHEAQKTWARYFIARGLAAMEAMMAANEARGVRGDFAYGGALTAADCFLVPQVYNARRFGVELSPYPRVVRADAAARETAPVKAAWPENQKDAPKGE